MSSRASIVAEEALGQLTEIVVHRADQTVFEVIDPVQTDRGHLGCQARDGKKSPMGSRSPLNGPKGLWMA